MTLKYRGITYTTSNLTINSQKTTVKALYRGQSYQVTSAVEFSFPPFCDLIYRGVKYPRNLHNNVNAIKANLQPVFN